MLPRVVAIRGWRLWGGTHQLGVGDGMSIRTLSMLRQMMQVRLGDTGFGLTPLQMRVRGPFPK